MGDKFVIRGYHWGYNDEIFYPCGSYIESVFEDEEKAKAALLELERKHWKQMDLGETGPFFDGSDSFIEKANAFIRGKCGKTLIEGDDPRGSCIPQELNDEDFMEFLELAGLHAYKLARFPENAKYYAIWLPDEDDFLKEYDEEISALVYEDTIDKLKEQAGEVLEYEFEENPVVIKGGMDEISSNPALLESLVADSQGLKLNKEEGVLKIDTGKVDDVFSVNELLKKPLFEIKALGLDEVKEIESEMECEE